MQSYQPKNSHLFHWVLQHLQLHQAHQNGSSVLAIQERIGDLVHSSGFTTSCNCEDIWRSAISKEDKEVCVLGEMNVLDVVEEQNTGDFDFGSEVTTEEEDMSSIVSENTEEEVSDEDEEEGYLCKEKTHLEELKNLDTSAMSKTQKKLHQGKLRQMEKAIKLLEKKWNQTKLERANHELVTEPKAKRPLDAHQVEEYMETGLDCAPNHDILLNFTSEIPEEEYISNKDGCIHSQCSLTTKNGFSLPNWLIFGFRHGLVSREISDIITGEFCISPVQIEIRDKESCYWIIEKVLKAIFTLVRGRGSDSVDWLHPAILEKLSSTTVFSGEKFRPKRRKRNNTSKFLWYIRDRGSLLRQNFDYEAIYSEYSSLPSLKCLQTLTQDEREKIFLQLILGADSYAEITHLPKDFVFPVLAMCYWFKNSYCKLSDCHMMTVLLCFITFFYNDRLPQSKSQKNSPCLHCLLLPEVGQDEIKIRNRVNNMKCVNIRTLSGSKNAKRKKKQLSVSSGSDKNEEKNKKQNKGAGKKLISQSSNANSEPEIISCADLLNSFTGETFQEECTDASNRLSAFHTVVRLANNNYDREFVHTMSEYQAVIHYLNLLNFVMLVSCKPASIEKLWSGTFSYNVYKILSKSTCSSSIIALILGIDSNLWKLFLSLYQVICKICNIDYQPIIRVSQLNKEELILTILNHMKTLADLKNEKNIKANKAIQNDHGMDVDEDCHFSMFSSVL